MTTPMNTATVAAWTVIEEEILEAYGDKDCSDSCDCEEDEYETVYSMVVGVDDLCGTVPHLQMFKTTTTEMGEWKTTYFQTYGGGPEGGYFQRTFYPLHGDPVDEVYKVERNWGTPFTVERIEGVVDLSGDEQSCRIVPKPQTHDPHP